MIVRLIIKLIQLIAEAFKPKKYAEIIVGEITNKSKGGEKNVDSN
jgi:hypothetical protein